MALRINSIDIFPREAHICVSIGNAFPKTVSSACAQYILQQYPQLANHACFSGGARVFGQVIQGTSVPHVLEHLIIHEQLLQCAYAYCASSALRLVGCTTWNNDEHTSALIRVMFYDDLVLLRALRTQTAFLNKALKQCS